MNITNPFLNTYDPKETVISLGVGDARVELVGWADGTYLTFERNSEFFNNKVGTMGETSRAYINDATCTFTIRLQATSPSIKALEDLKVVTSVLKAPPVMGLYVTNPAQFETILVAQCWIQKDPTREYSDEVGIREYTFFGVMAVTGSNDKINLSAQVASQLF